LTDFLAIEQKLQAARTRLILDKPFLGALVLRLPLVRANPDWCTTTATNAQKFFYNAEYINTLSSAQTQFILAHEALHCGLSHFTRREHRVKMHWDAACDYAINPLLIDDGLTPPQGSLHLPAFNDMTAEEIYPCIDENSELETLDEHLYDADTQEGWSQQNANGDNSKAKTEPQQRDAKPNNTSSRNESSPSNQPQQQQSEKEQGSTRGAAKPPPLNPQEQDDLSLQWQQRLVGAAQQAMQAGKMGEAMARMVDFTLQPALPWRNLLSRYVSSIARDDYNYSRPSNRRGDPAIFPSLRSAQLDLAVAIDVSGSISDKEISEFISEISAIKSQMRCRVTLMTCDAQLTGNCPWEFEPWEDMELPSQVQGGGGTSFHPPFEHIDQSDGQPDILIYFTDAQGSFPKNPPPYAVLWLVKGRNKVPWGERIPLN
jgi:predicted metal-dependent peptidase